MEIIQTSIPEVLLIKPAVFKDARGYFYEVFNKSVFEKLGLITEFVQDNQSMSEKGTVRGLHFQAPPFDQGKLVTVIKGAVIDVAVDIRRSSPFYGQTVAIELNEDNKYMLWIPSGFAHGFSTLKDNTIFQYKCTNFYNKSTEGGIIWNDLNLDIQWNVDNPIISEKDNQLPSFNNFISPF